MIPPLCLACLQIGNQFMKVPATYEKSLNIHQIELEKYFGVDHLIARTDFEIDCPDIVFICFTNRCGSNFLGELLNATGKFNKAREFLNHDVVKSACMNQSISNFTDYFIAMVHANTVDGRCAIKASPEQILMLADWGILQMLSNKLKFVCIERNDKVRQCVSFSIAEQSGQWSSVGAKKPGTDVVFDIKSLLDKLKYICRQNDYLEHFLVSNKIVAHRLVYEDLVLDTKGELDLIADFLRISSSLTPDISLVSIKPQAGKENELFRDKFISWLGLNLK